MAFSDALQELKEFDVNELNADNIGSWPIAIKVIVWVIVLCCCIGGRLYVRCFRLAEEFGAGAKERAGL